jgi:hypothetical protein
MVGYIVYTNTRSRDICITTTLASLTLPYIILISFGFFFAIAGAKSSFFLKSTCERQKTRYSYTRSLEAMCVCACESSVLAI